MEPTQFVIVSESSNEVAFFMLRVLKVIFS